MRRLILSLWLGTTGGWLWGINDAQGVSETCSIDRDRQTEEGDGNAAVEQKQAVLEEKKVKEACTEPGVKAQEQQQTIASALVPSLPRMPAKDSDKSVEDANDNSRVSMEEKKSLPTVDPIVSDEERKEKTKTEVEVQPSRSKRSMEDLTSFLQSALIRPKIDSKDPVEEKSQQKQQVWSQAKEAIEELNERLAAHELTEEEAKQLYDHYEYYKEAAALGIRHPGALKEETKSLLDALYRAEKTLDKVAPGLSKITLEEWLNHPSWEEQFVAGAKESGLGAALQKLKQLFLSRHLLRVLPRDWRLSSGLSVLRKYGLSSLQQQKGSFFPMVSEAMRASPKLFAGVQQSLQHAMKTFPQEFTRGVRHPFLWIFTAINAIEPIVNYNRGKITGKELALGLTINIGSGIMIALPYVGLPLFSGLAVYGMVNSIKKPAFVNLADFRRNVVCSTLGLATVPIMAFHPLLGILVGMGLGIGCAVPEIIKAVNFDGDPLYNIYDFYEPTFSMQEKGLDHDGRAANFRNYLAGVRRHSASERAGYDPLMKIRLRDVWLLSHKEMDSVQKTIVAAQEALKLPQKAGLDSGLYGQEYSDLRAAFPEIYRKKNHQLEKAWKERKVAANVEEDKEEEEAKLEEGKQEEMVKEEKEEGEALPITNRQPLVPWPSFDGESNHQPASAHTEIEEPATLALLEDLLTEEQIILALIESFQMKKQLSAVHPLFPGPSLNKIADWEVGRKNGSANGMDSESKAEDNGDKVLSQDEKVMNGTVNWEIGEKAGLTTWLGRELTMKDDEDKAFSQDEKSEGSIAFPPIETNGNALAEEDVLPPALSEKDNDKKDIFPSQQNDAPIIASLTQPPLKKLVDGLAGKKGLNVAALLEEAFKEDGKPTSGDESLKGRVEIQSQLQLPTLTLEDEEEFLEDTAFIFAQYPALPDLLAFFRKDRQEKEKKETYLETRIALLERMKAGLTADFGKRHMDLLTAYQASASKGEQQQQRNAIKELLRYRAFVIYYQKLLLKLGKLLDLEELQEKKEVALTRIPSHKFHWLLQEGKDFSTYDYRYERYGYKEPWLPESDRKLKAKHWYAYRNLGDFEDSYENKQKAVNHV